MYTAASLDTGVSQGYQATIPLPIHGRIGDGMDFLWQRSPFGVGVHLHDSSRPFCQQTPPTPGNIMICGSDPGREDQALITYCHIGSVCISASCPNNENGYVHFRGNRELQRGN